MEINDSSNEPLEEVEAEVEEQEEVQEELETSSKKKSSSSRSSRRSSSKKSSVDITLVLKYRFFGQFIVQDEDGNRYTYPIESWIESGQRVQSVNVKDLTPLTEEMITRFSSSLPNLRRLLAGDNS